ncbi:PAS domain S-box protein [Desulfovibrio aminophilus]|nr:PAS domain S-box protein [Desulfovibrio aminophilus]
MKKCPQLSRIVNRTLAAWALLPSMVLVLLLAGFGALALYGDFKRESGHMVTALARHVESYVGDASQTLETFGAGLEDVAADHVGETLRAMLRASPHFKRLILLDQNGDILASAPGGLPGGGFALSLERARNNALIISRPMYSTASGQPVIYLGQRLPRGILAAELDLGVLQRTLQELLPPDEGDLILTDAFGNVISHPDTFQIRSQANLGRLPPLRLAENEPATLPFQKDGTLWLGTGLRLPYSAWKLTLMKPAWAVFAPTVAPLASLLACLVLALALLAVRVQRLLRRRVVEPLTGFVSAIRDMARGGLPGMAGTGRPSFRELSEAVEEFGRMAQAVRDRGDALRESEARYRVLFEESSVVMMLVDPADGRILDVNPAAASFYGWSREQMRGKSMFEINTLPPGELRDVLAKARSRQRRHFRFRHRLAHGEIREVEVYTCPITTKAGLLLYSSIFDVTDRHLAEQALAHSEERLRLALDAADDGLWDWNLVTGEVYWSPRAYTMLGYKPDEFPMDYEVWRGLLHPDDRERAASEVQRQLASESGSFQTDFRLRTRNGGWRWIISRGKVVERDAAGRLARMVGTHVDITERKLAEEELERIFSMSLNLLCVAEIADMRFVKVNPAFTQVLGYSQEEIVGKTILDFLHPADVEPSVRAVRERLAAGAVVADFENRYRRKDGTYRWLRWVSHPDPERGLTYAAAHDITDMKEAEENLIRMRDRAEAANRAKSEFLAIMSHEIRTPLNGIMGMLQLLRESPQAAERDTWTGTALAAARHLNQILSDVLDLSSIESGRWTPQETPFSLEAVVRPVLGSFAEAARNKGVALAADLDPRLDGHFLGDPGRIRQILFNLVGNALKYTDQGEIRVQAYPLPVPPPSGGVNLHLVVADTGIGIPDDKLREIFEPFTQVENAYTRRQGGAGLGLTIVRRLVERLGGALALCSEPGRGTEAHLTLPLLPAEPAEHPAPGPGTDAAPARKLKILLVEDERVNRLATRRMLERLGHQAAEASDGAEALDILSREDFDAVLMDIQMPGMDGLEATRRLRADASLGARARAPVIALTAHTLSGDRERFLDAGMDGYLSKPTELDALKAELARLFPPPSGVHGKP